MVIDLRGENGNAFVLLARASVWAKELGLDGESILQEMKSGDYDNLLSVMEKHFPFVEFIYPEEDDEY